MSIPLTDPFTDFTFFTFIDPFTPFANSPIRPTTIRQCGHRPKAKPGCDASVENPQTVFENGQPGRTPATRTRLFGNILRRQPGRSSKTLTTALRPFLRALGSHLII